MKRFLSAAVFAFALVLAASFSHALNLGGYATIEGGSGEIDPEKGEQFEISSRAWGGGLTLDTNPMTRDFFSYRLNLGAHSATFEPEEGDNLDGMAFIIDNTFTFTLSSEEGARYWLGPLVRFAGYSFSADGYDVKLSDVGIGVAGGFTYKLADKWIVSPSLGGVYNMMSGTDDSAGDDLELNGRLFSFFAKVDFLYDL